MEEIDLRVIYRKLRRKWYWFALSLCISLALAILYLIATEQTYQIEASVQLKDQSLSSKGTAQEKFISGFELLESGGELEDEIGILTSYSTIHESLEQLDFDVRYFEYDETLKFLGDRFASQVYPPPFSVYLDTGEWQLLGTPIYLSFPDTDHYRVTLEADDLPLNVYQRGSERIEVWPTEVTLDTTLNVNDTLRLPYLSMSVAGGYVEQGKGYYISLRSLHDVTDYYREKLQVETISENSNIASLRLISAVPEKDKMFLQALASVYIENDLEKKNQLGRKTMEFIDYQLASVADSLQQTEGSLQNFRSQNKVINVEATSQKLNDQLFALEEKQAQLSVQNEYYKYMARYLASNDDVTDVVAPSSIGIEDELFNSLLLQLADLNEEKISKDYASNPNNPVVRIIERKINNTKQALIDNTDNLINSNAIALRENNRRIAAIQRQMNRLPQNERNLTDIERRFTFNDNIYNYLLQKRAEAGIAVASNVADKSIVDPARLASKDPIGPNKPLVLVVALLGGLAVPLGLILASMFFSQEVESDEQLRSWTDIPVIERVARVSEKEKKQAYVSEGYIAHSFRYIRHHVDFLRLSQEVQVVGVTSAKSGEGKTFIARHLAESFARAGRKTILVDIDLHRPTLHTLMNVPLRPGLSDMLLHDEKKIVQSTKVPGLDIISAGSTQLNPSDLLTLPSLATIFAKLKEKYEMVILDTPPLGVIADYLMLSKHVDYTLMILQHEFSQKEEIIRLDKLVKQHQFKCGIIYNQAMVSEDSKGYYKKVIAKA